MIRPQALVQAERLAVTYPGQIRALEDLNFEIPRGQFVSIVGPSGCGKSTLLRVLAGLIDPTGGRLRVADLPPAAARRFAVRLSFVFQDATLLPWRSVLDNVRLPLELASAAVNDQRSRAEDALRGVGLDEFIHRFPNELSGGMRMRVSLARALVTEPELLLLDEPFGALDDLTRQTLNDELLRLWRMRRWSGVFITHNIAEAVYLSERILVLSARPGRIAADLRVELPSERDGEIRATAEFARVVGEVAARLRRGAE